MKPNHVEINGEWLGVEFTTRSNWKGAEHLDACIRELNDLVRMVKAARREFFPTTKESK